MKKKLYLNGTITPAVVIILIMILINAGVILYFANHFDKADETLQNNVTQVQEIAKSNRLILAEQAQERTIRSDQACELFETDHLQDVQSLGATYKYLAQLTPEERNQALNRFILLQLPQTEQQALVDRAPEYCDETTPTGDDVGLPEPDPVVPDRPAKLVAILGPRPDYPTPVQKQQNKIGQDLRNK